MVSKSIKRDLLGYKMLLPSVIMICAVSIYPLLNGIYISFTGYNFLDKTKNKFVGLDNFYRLITQDEEFRSVLLFSFEYTIAVVALSYFCGLILALILNNELKCRNFLRALVLIPWVIPPVVAATSWMSIMNDQTGIINVFLMSTGIIESPILFFANRTMAKLTVIIVGTWKSFPFMFISLLASLQSIPKPLYEAAYIDGGGYFKTLFFVTMPFLKKISVVCTTLMFIWTFNSFDNIYLLTQGGPSYATFVLPILSYYTAFFRGQLGYASAISTLMLIVLTIIFIFYYSMQKEKDD